VDKGPERESSSAIGDVGETEKKREGGINKILEGNSEI